MASLTVPDKPSVLALVTPLELIVPVNPPTVPRVELIVSAGAVVSTLAVTAEVVVLLPNVLVALAVKLCEPSAKLPVV